MAKICHISEPKMHYIAKMVEFKMPPQINKRIIGKTSFWNKDEILPWLEKHGYFKFRIDGKAPTQNYDDYFNNVLSRFVDRTRKTICEGSLYMQYKNTAKKIKTKEYDEGLVARYDDNFGMVMK